ncbi:MAG: pantoate--beta-alanine ligase [Sphingobacteriales bacterium]|nr:MAG: pantoate--beta-alanine ligase [Sphingobacteriales bacterium]
MYIFKTVSNLQRYLFLRRNEGKKIGFVPTMGALHEGHISLIKQSKKTANITVCSIFVNPSQFNDKDDLAKYPRTTEADIELLEKNNCHVLFLPNEKEVYPNSTSDLPVFDFGYLDKPMEGLFRPGHFTGMAQVVKRLLDIVHPVFLFMGQKDYQQFKIVEKMLELTKSKVQLVMCPTLREKSGLAMSSRNERLDPSQRKKAASIYKTLQFISQHHKTKSVEQVKKEAIEYLYSEASEIKVEYLEICNADNLMPVVEWKDTAKIVVCIAAKLGNIRLIDNLLISDEPKTSEFGQ